MKLFAGEIQDFEDVRGILQVSGNHLDLPPLRRLARRYGVEVDRKLDAILEETPPSRQPSHDSIGAAGILFLNCGKVSPPGSAGDSSVVAPALSESAFGQFNCDSCGQDNLVPFSDGLSVEVSALVRTNTG